MNHTIENCIDWNDEKLRHASRRLHSLTRANEHLAADLERDCIRYGQNIRSLRARA